MLRFSGWLRAKVQALEKKEKMQASEVSGRLDSRHRKRVQPLKTRPPVISYNRKLLQDPATPGSWTNSIYGKTSLYRCYFMTTQMESRMGWPPCSLHWELDFNPFNDDLQWKVILKGESRVLLEQRLELQSTRLFQILIIIIFSAA